MWQVKALAKSRQCLINARSVSIKLVPSTPVVVMGLNAVPEAGDLFQVVGSVVKDGQLLLNARKPAKPRKM